MLECLVLEDVECVHVDARDRVFEHVRFEFAKHVQGLVVCRLHQPRFVVVLKQDSEEHPFIDHHVGEALHVDLAKAEFEEFDPLVILATIKNFYGAHCGEHGHDTEVAA